MSNGQVKTERLAKVLVEDLGPIGLVTYERRFRGFALLEDGVMFGLLDHDGTIFLRTSLQSGQRFHEMDSKKHPELPYWSVPDALSWDLAALRELAYEAADIAHIAATFGIDDEEDARHTVESITPLRAMITFSLLAA